MGFKVIGGDFPASASFSSTLGSRYLSWGFGNKIDLNYNVQSVSLITEESKSGFLKKTGAGIVGGAVFGIAGALAGALAAGNTKEICFLCRLKDGRSFTAVADVSTYQKIAALSAGTSNLAGVPGPAKKLGGPQEMSLYNTTETHITGECNSCGRVLKIPLNKTQENETNYSVFAPHGVKCPCGIIHYVVNKA